MPEVSLTWRICLGRSPWQHVCWRYFPGWRGISVPEFVTGVPTTSVRLAVRLSFQDGPYISLRLAGPTIAIAMATTGSSGGRVFRVSDVVSEPRCRALSAVWAEGCDLVSGRGCCAMCFRSRLPVSSGEGFRHWASHRGAEPAKRPFREAVECRFTLSCASRQSWNDSCTYAKFPPPEQGDGAEVRAVLRADYAWSTRKQGRTRGSSRRSRSTYVQPGSWPLGHGGEWVCLTQVIPKGDRGVEKFGASSVGTWWALLLSHSLQECGGVVSRSRRSLWHCDTQRLRRCPHAPWY